MSRDARTVLDLLDRTRASYPDRVALEIPGAGAWTYAELDAMSRHCAAAVLGALEGRATRDAVVAIALPRTSPRLYSALIGTMRAGAAYLAIDPAFPARQVASVLADAGASVLIAAGPRAAEILAAAPADMRIPILGEDALAESGVSVPPPGAPAAALSSAEATGSLVPQPGPQPGDLAYVIYTSGTTGRPKGVEIEHRSLLQLVEGDRADFGLGPDDRVAQGSSASYDSSVEEMWLAWAAGGAVVVMDDETARLGPDLLPWLAQQRITVLCPPPTLLRTLACDDPARALPALRFVYVGGEALPPDIADRWSRGKRLENGYGPTECTVTCLRSTVLPGEPVTIGRAIPGSFAATVDPEDPSLRRLEDGLQGELVVGGAALARGYRGQPETTAARFVVHPELGRVYRTGDLVHRDARGDFHYHGRIDAQVKLRGYRIELGAVEAALAAQDGVLEAAATVEDAGTPRARLVAHAVARPGRSIDAASLRSALADELPHYMVPAAVAAIGAVPRTVGGKIDRRRLPIIPRDAADAGPEAGAAPASACERAVSAAFAAALGRDGLVPVDADLFDDLGLDSLTIAIAVSRLRGSAATRVATVRLAYEHRTVRDIAQAIESRTVAAHRADSDAVGDTTGACRSHAEPTGTSRPALFTLGQAAVLAVLVLAISQLLWIPSLGTTVDATLGDGVRGAALLAAVGGLSVAGYAVLSVAAAVLAKWTLIGRYRPMRARAFSWWHLRHWTVCRFAALVPWDLLEATDLAPMALRLLGARIGSRVHVHRGVRLNDGGWDLLELGDDATIGQDACLRTVELASGSLVVGPVTVARGATLETRAGLSPGATLGEGSILRALSNLRGGTVRERMIYDGIPAEPVARAPEPPRVRPAPPRLLRAGAAVLLLAAIAAVLLVPWTVGAWVAGLLPDGPVHDELYGPGGSIVPSASGLARLALATVLAGCGTVLVQALLVRMLGRAPREAYALGSLAHLRMSLQSMLVEGAGKWLSGTLMWPMWLNLAGARIGRGCEISTVTDVVPSTVEIGRGTFFADGIYLGGPRLHGGTATIEPVQLDEACFVGNHAVLPSGSRIATETLVGISTRGDGLPNEAGASWFGHPVFRLPRREIVEMPRDLTHDPPLLRRVNRWAWELARFALPIGPVFVALVAFRALEFAFEALDGPAFRLAALPLTLLGTSVALAGAVLAAKWTLVGRVKPGTHALWSCWCSRWDFLFVMWGMWASIPLAFLEGTLILVAYLRMMGCRIGRRALLGGGFSHVVDPDMLRFGDDVTVQALFQAHTFEDRVLKIDHVDVEDGASVGANTVLLYGARVGRGAVVEPHSVVMKREVLVEGTRYEGVPTQPVGLA